MKRYSQLFGKYYDGSQELYEKWKSHEFDKKENNDGSMNE